MPKKPDSPRQSLIFGGSPTSASFSDRPSYLPGDIQNKAIPRSLIEEMGFWSMGEGQQLSTESAKALIEAEILAMRLRASGLLEGMGLDVECDKKESLKGHHTKAAVLSLRINEELIKRGSSLGVSDFLVLAIAARLHDIGKLNPMINRVVMSDKKLIKGSPEWNTVTLHPSLGAEVIQKTICAEVMQDARGRWWMTDEIKKLIARRMKRITDAVHQHHEKLDGSGYYGIKGEDICPEALIIGVADIVDAMGEPRTYRPSLPPTEIMDYLWHRENEHPREILEIMDGIHHTSGIIVRHKSLRVPV